MRTEQTMPHHAALPPRKELLAAVVALALALGIVALAQTSVDVFRSGRLATLLMVAILSLPMLWLIRKWRSADILHPWPVFSVFVFALYGLNLVAGLLSGMTWADEVAPGVLLAVIGMDVGIGLGVRFGGMRDRPPFDRAALMRWVPMISIVLVALGATYIVRAGGLATLLATRIADRGATAQAASEYLLWGARTGAIFSTGLLAAWYATSGERRRPSVLILLLLGWTAAFLAVTGWRLDVFAFGLLLVCVLRFSARWSSLRISVLLGIVASYYLLYGLIRTLSAGDSATAYFLRTTNSPLELFVAVSSVQLGDFNYAFHLIQTTFPGSLDFMWGRSAMINLATLAPGYQPLFDDYLKDLYNLHFGGGGLNPGIVGELYLTAGYPAVFGGMVVLGWIVAVQYKRVRNAATPQNVMGYGLALAVGGLSLAQGSIDLIILLVYGAAIRLLFAMAGSVERPSRFEIATLTLAIIAAGAETLRAHAWILPWMVPPGN